MDLILPRDTFTKDTTLGTLYLEIFNGGRERICETLEDARRFPGVKVYGETCLPAGRYRLGITRSTRFKRDMVIIYNCSNGYEIKAEGISYKGVRMHGLNDSSETLGCIGVAKHRSGDERIYGTAEKEVTKLVKDAIDRGEEAWLEISD